MYRKEKSQGVSYGNGHSERRKSIEHDYKDSNGNRISVHE